MVHYRRTYLCICEGQQEKMYLNHLASLINDFPRKMVKFNTFIDTPHRLVKRYEEYDSAAVFDYDFNDVEFKRNIKLCDELNRKLKSTKKYGGRYIYHAYSNVNFDLWLILHKENYNRLVSRNDAYICDVRRIYGLGMTDNIKNEDNIIKILSQITLEDVKNAIIRAKNIRSSKDQSIGTKVGIYKLIWRK